MERKLSEILARSVAEILRQGVDLLEVIDDESYTRAQNEAYTDGGAVGGHFRHCLEFVICFLTGAAGGRVDYNRRERNFEIETNRRSAIREYEKTIEELENFVSPGNDGLLVKPEDVARDEDLWCASSVARELEFLHSHTIHHYALIGFKLRALGFNLPAEFGVAPSTLKFWRREKSAAK